MPNHVTTRITGPAEIISLITRLPNEKEHIAHEEYEAMRKKAFAARGEEDLYTYTPLNTEKPLVDFALVIPEPENIETGSCSGHHEDGVICWYDWNINNWGTKWNGYDLEIENEDDTTATLRFDTAWSHPSPVIETLSTKLSAARLDIEFADEDLGHNLRKYTIVNGEITEFTDFQPGSPEAVDFAATVKYGMSYADLCAEWGVD